MAGAIIIASAIGILLLVLVGYVLVGGTLVSADSIASAQKDMTIKKEAQMDTAIQVSNAKWFSPPTGSLHNLTFDLKNIGSEPIGDFNHTDMVISISGGVPEYYSFNGVVSGNTPGYNYSKTWGYMTITPDTIHPYMLDPGEKMGVEIDNYIISGTHPNAVVNVTTPNGITAVGRTP